MSPHPTLRIRSPKSEAAMTRSRQIRRSWHWFVLRTLACLFLLLGFHLHARIHSLNPDLLFGATGLLLCNLGLFILSLVPPASEDPLEDGSGEDFSFTDRAFQSLPASSGSHPPV